MNVVALRLPPISVLLFALVLLPAPTPSLADGAVAVGIAAKGVTQGYSTGYSINKANEKDAREAALAGCRNSYVASGTPENQGIREARAQCEVVTTFRNKCAAGALDPKNGTPGVGWAIGDSQQDADAEALNRCRSTAGADRKAFCVVMDRHCDGSAK